MVSASRTPHPRLENKYILYLLLPIIFTKTKERHLLGKITHGYYSRKYQKIKLGSIFPNLAIMDLGKKTLGCISIPRKDNFLENLLMGIIQENIRRSN